MGGEVDWGRRTTGTRVASVDWCHPTRGAVVTKQAPGVLNVGASGSYQRCSQTWCGILIIAVDVVPNCMTVLTGRSFWYWHAITLQYPVKAPRLGAHQCPGRRVGGEAQ